VKHVESGEIFYVIAPNPEDKDWIMVLTEDGYKDEVLAKNCEPVPEESRPFRCGDKVVARHRTGGEQEYFGVISALSANAVYFSDEWFFKSDVRLATPQEIIDHFAPNA
jgi:hypothetical protein